MDTSLRCSFLCLMFYLHCIRILHYLYSHPARFFAGGSERSGQQIVGPPKKKSPNEVVEDLFKGAREHGAVPLDRSGRGPGEPSRARVKNSQEQCCCLFFWSSSVLSDFLLILWSLILSILSLHHLGFPWWRLQARCSS